MVSEVAGQRRKKNRTSTDMLGMLMEARDRKSQAMPDRQLVSEIMTLIVAGHETTASTLNWTWYLLAKSAEVEEKLLSELNALPGSGSPEIATWRNSSTRARSLKRRCGCIRLVG